jgi:hypothetical protein
LNTLLLRLEEYNAVRVEPAARSYSDVAMVRELWPEQGQAENVSASHPKTLDGDASTADVLSEEPKIAAVASGEMDQDEKVAAE